MSRSLYLGPWRVDLNMRTGVRAPISGAALARAMAAAAEAAGAPTPASIGLILSDDAELAALNAGHLGKHGPTDVLSFPLLPPHTFPDHPGRLGHSGHAGDSGHPGQSGGPAPASQPVATFALPPGSRPHLGDVVVSVERAMDQAIGGRGGQTGTVRWAPADELRLLAIHGTLHLCGWDHVEPAEEAAMRALEKRLLGPSGPPRSPSCARPQRDPAWRTVRP